MIIVDPVALGDAACARPSTKWVWDRAGTLVEVPADTLGVTYDPLDLNKAPYALIEPEATNVIRNNSMQGVAAGSPGSTPTYWGIEGSGTNGLIRTVSPVGVEDGIEYFEVRYAGTATASGTHQIGFDSTTSAAASTGEAWAATVFLASIGDAVGVINPRLQISERTAAGAQIAVGEVFVTLAPNRLSKSRIELVHTIGMPDVGRISHKFIFSYANGTAVDITLRIGLPQLERDRVTSPIKTSNGAVTRAADVIGSTAGLIYSNVPMVEPPYSATTTYAQGAAVYDPATKIVYWSMQAANVGKPLSDPAWWNKRTAINRWAMFDDRNSTVTSNPEEIIAVVSARAITQGMFAGALDASEVLVSMTHPTRGVVYSEKRNLVLPRSGSSFFGWCFNRLRMRTWFLTLKLPVFANALVTITIRRPGGVAKCGMCMIGPAIDVGLSLMGLSTELKDYSTTTFYPDGSSDTIPRGFSKRMSIDLSVERDRVETIEDDLIKRRQKTLVWLGSTMRGDTMLVGKFSSFRKVIDSYPRSKMALQIEGVLSQ